MAEIKPAEHIQRIETKGFGRELQYTPEEVPTYYTSNIVSRTLAHMVGWDGSQFVPLQAGPGGSLTVEGAEALINDEIMGVLRSVGDAGTTPANVAGETVLKRLSDIETDITGLRSVTEGDIRDRLSDVERNTLRTAEVLGAHEDAVILTTTPLAAGATYTSPRRDIHRTRIRQVTVTSFSDADAHPLGLWVEQSANGLNWDQVSLKVWPRAGRGMVAAYPLSSRYYRVVYVNGVAAQTVFRLATRTTL